MAISDTHTLVMLGASITAAMVGTRALAWENYVLNKTGLTVTVVNEGVGGDRLSDIDTRLNILLPLYAGDSNVLFCLHGLANDLLDHAPYRDMTAQAQADLYDEYEALIQRIVNNGNRVDIASSTFINFDLDNSAVTDEDKGSFAFNQNIVNPIAKIYNPPELYDTVNDRPVSDLYNFTFNSFTEIQLPDGIHYETWGYEALANFRLSRIVDAIYLSKPPAKINKLSNPVTGFKKTAGSFVLDFRTGTVLGTSQYLLGMTVMPSTGAASGTRILPKLPNVSSVMFQAGASTSNSGGLGNPGDPSNTTQTIENNDLLSTIHFTTTAGGTKTITFSGMGANSKWLARFSCASNTGLDVSTDVTINGIETLAIDDDPLVINEVNVTADSSGEVSVEYKANAASGYGVINGIEFVLLESRTAVKNSTKRSIKENMRV